MLEAMMNAKVGDDVFHEDPSINELEAFAADMFGMEEAMFCPSGTMSNEIAVKAHTNAGDEVICEYNSHIYVYEGGGIAFNSFCQVRPIPGNRGRIKAHQVLDSINPDDIHRAPTRLVSLENTCNRGGGSCYDWNDITEITNVCRDHHLNLHLDGARLFNALAETEQTPRQYGSAFDSINICLSKGLGAPVGSLLLGSSAFIKKSRRIRKVWGGGMRQAGFLGAAGLFALKNNVHRLHDDHLRALKIAEALNKKSFIGEIMPVETNIIIFEVKGSYTAKSLAEKFKENQILVIPISETKIRIVLHLDISPAMVNETIQFIDSL